MSSQLHWNTEQSPFASVIGTNYSPTADECNKLEAHLADPLRQLARLDTEIGRIRNLLDGLTSEKQVLMNYIHAHQVLLSPIRQLPAETLAEIFSYCLPPLPVRDLKEAPLLLTTVSRDWRNIALNTPLLWSSLHVYLPSDLSGDAFAQRVAGLTRWFSRSGSLPLTISLHGLTNPQADVDSLENMRLMIHSLMAFSHEFHKLFLSLSPSVFSVFTELSPSLFPTLAALRIRNADIHHFRSHAWDARPPRNALDLDSLLSKAPKLTVLDINQYHYAGSYPSLPCAWDNITCLNLDDALTPRQMITILAQAPHLVNTALKVSLTAESADSCQVVHLTKLLSMRLTCSGWDSDGTNILANLTATLKYISCVALKSFDLSLFHLGVGVLCSEHLPFCCLPLQKLETLVLRGLSLAPQTLANCLSQARSLLTFQYCFPTSEGQPQDWHLLSFIPSLDNPDPWCPCLENIQIVGERGEFGASPTVSAKALIAFLEHRSKTTLKSCSILFSSVQQQPSFTDMDLSTLRALKMSGLKLRLQSARSFQAHKEPDFPTLGLNSNSDFESHEPEPVRFYDELEIVVD